MTAKLSMICSKQSNGTYFAVCPEIKGCFTQGDTYEEAYTNLRELVDISIREELTEDDIEGILLSKTKIFSEFEIAV
ncbi:MAG: type II toxin-antitoxin system HicB family antitoxin [Treponema sp.]|nr:type II toxin-antitoxin system HicB family antitoxin [Treponema sp.]